MRYLPALLLVGCAAPDPSELFGSADLVVAEGEDEAAAPFVDAIEGARESLYIALPGGQNTDISGAIAQAYDDGVDVEVVTDVDLATSPAVQELLDADVPVTLADGGLAYFDFNQNLDIGWDSTQTMMTDAWVVADHYDVVFADRVGTGDDGTRIVYRMRGEDLVDDVLSEHNQLFGGTDATAIDAYSAPSKSILDTRWRYGTGTDVDFELYFGPQERLLKRVIDAVYSARSSVWILTDDFASDGLATALEAKAQWGFDVQVVVGPHFGDSSDPLSRTLTDSPDVKVRQITGVDDVPTLVLVDYDETDDGMRGDARALVLTHDLYSASRLYRGAPVETDQVIDGTLYELSDVNQPSPMLVQLSDVFQQHFDRSEAL
jgi:hypothetical protein